MVDSNGHVVRAVSLLLSTGSASVLVVPVDVISEGFFALSAAVLEGRVKEGAQPEAAAGFSTSPPQLLSAASFLFFLHNICVNLCFSAAATLQSRETQIAKTAAVTIMYCEDGSLRTRQLGSPWQHFLLCRPCSCVSLPRAACKPGLQEHHKHINA